MGAFAADTGQYRNKKPPLAFLPSLLAGADPFVTLEQMGVKT